MELEKCIFQYKPNHTFKESRDMGASTLTTMVELIKGLPQLEISTSDWSTDSMFLVVAYSDSDNCSIYPIKGKITQINDIWEFTEPGYNDMLPNDSYPAPDPNRFRNAYKLRFIQGDSDDCQTFKIMKTVNTKKIPYRTLEIYSQLDNNSKKMLPDKEKKDSLDGLPLLKRKKLLKFLSSVGYF